MSTNRYANGHRRRQLRARILAEEHLCWVCGQPVDKTLTILWGKHSDRCTNPTCAGCVPHPMAPEIDEIIPVSQGGSPTDRANCHLAHRKCNVGRNRTRPRLDNRPAYTTSRQWGAPTLPPA